MTNDHTSERPPYIEQLRAEARGLPYRPAKRKKSKGAATPDPDAARYIFTVFTGNRWMELGSREKPAKMLFGEFWYQNELCFLFANTNAGKSILAVQIGNAISRGSKAGPFPCTAPAAKVLYADFELSNLQFHLRYSDQGTHYNFNDNFLRAQFNPATGITNHADSFRNDELLMDGLEYRIQQLKATVLIIDNVSCLGGGTENASGALNIMKRLHALRADYKLSILVLAHTPKRRNPQQPLSANDLHGSKLLINLADSAFTIGVSNTDSDLHYLNQIKQRSTQQVYGDDNVCLCRIRKPRNFLQFQFAGNSAEHPHLLNRAKAQREQLTEQITQLSADGNTQRQIGQQLNIAVSTVNKLLNR
jgi:DNA-binding NarL/FixJ family response regulator